MGDPRVGLMILIPGIGDAMRLDGRAVVEDDPTLPEPFSIDGKTPRTVVIVDVRAVSFQRARGLMR